MTRACHTGTIVPGRRGGRKAPGDEVTRPRRCTCSRRADHHISGLPPAGLCRDDRPGHQSRPGADAPSARRYTRCRTLTRRHCAALGFTDSGQRRFSTHFSAQRGNTAKPRSYFSWSRRPSGVADPSLLLASQAGHTVRFPSPAPASADPSSAWACGADDLRPIRPADRLLIRVPPGQRQPGLACKACCACGMLAPARMPCSPTPRSRCGCVFTGPPTGPGPVWRTCGSCWWPTY